MSPRCLTPAPQCQPGGRQPDLVSPVPATALLPLHTRGDSLLFPGEGEAATTPPNLCPSALPNMGQPRLPPARPTHCLACPSSIRALGSRCSDWTGRRAVPPFTQHLPSRCSINACPVGRSSHPCKTAGCSTPGCSVEPLDPGLQQQAEDSRRPPPCPPAAPNAFFTGHSSEPTASLPIHPQL